jgi:hypothetical protein
MATIRTAEKVDSILQEDFRNLYGILLKHCRNVTHLVTMDWLPVLPENNQEH